MRGQADHLDGLVRPGARPERPGQADEAGPAGRGGPGSREALLQRLRNLPAWHPSSLRPGRRAEASDQPSADGDSDAARRSPEGPPPSGSRPDAPREAALPPPDEARRHPDLRRNPFWDKVTDFQSVWRTHEARWPGRPRSGDRARPGDPPGSWRGDGHQYLTPQQNAEADNAIAVLRAPEEEVTSFLQQLQEDNPYGGHLIGLEHRLKGDGRIKEKIVESKRGESALTVADAAGLICDAVRYTWCFSGEQYVKGAEHIREQMTSAGYEMTYCRNRWLDDPQYKGINSRWRAPSGGQFELQFHTPESFYAKEVLTHRSYGRLRSPGLGWAERAELQGYQRTVAGALPEPPGIGTVSDWPERV